MSIAQVDRVVEEARLGEVMLVLGNPEPNATIASQEMSVLLYSAPVNKRAFIKDIRIAEFGSGDSAGWLQGEEELTFDDPPSGTTMNDLLLFSGRMMIIKSGAAVTDKPNAVYLPNFSGGVLPTIIVEPGEQLWLHWSFAGASVAISNGILVHARAHGVEVSIP